MPKCYYPVEEPPEIEFPIFSAIKLETDKESQHCFGFICNIIVDTDYSFKVLILKMENKKALTENDFNNKSFILATKFEEGVNRYVFNPKKRKFYFNSILNIAFIEVKANDKIAVDYIYSDNVKSEYIKPTYFIKLASQTLDIKKFLCTIQDYNDNFIYSCLSQKPLIGNPILICEKGEKIKILGIHVGKSKGKTFKKGMIFKNFIFSYIQNFMKKEICLSPKNISEKDSQSVQKNNTFCESFFLVSIVNKKNMRIKKGIKEINEEFDCGHKSCFNNNPIEPDIIYQYTSKDCEYEEEIIESVKNICFPSGLTVCFKQNEKSIKVIPSYSSFFTDNKRNRFYAVTYRFYLKMDFSNFKENYGYYILNCRVEMNANFIYMPYCLCLVSKYPFYEAMEQCLKSIMMSIIYDSKPDKTNALINYIIKSIPLPTINSEVSFDLPYSNKNCKIQCLFADDIFKFKLEDWPIFKILSIQNMIILFKLLIYEKQIIVKGKNNNDISKFILNFTSLLYPFKWNYKIIHIMTLETLEKETSKIIIEHSPPFLFGIYNDLFKKEEINICDNLKDAFIIDIDNDSITPINGNKNNKNLEDLKSFPKDIEENLLYILSLIEGQYNTKEEINCNQLFINIKLKIAFCFSLGQILYFYQEYSYLVDNRAIFNLDLFLKKKSIYRKNSTKKFYEYFVSTKMFKAFLPSSFYNDKNTYFEECMLEMDSSIKELINTKNQEKKQKMIINICDKMEDKYVSFQRILNNYIIKEYNLKNKDKEIFNDKGKIKDEKRIAERSGFLVIDYKPKNYNIFPINQTNFSYTFETQNEEKNDLIIFINSEELMDPKEHAKSLMIKLYEGKITPKEFEEIKKYIETKSDIVNLIDNITLGNKKEYSIKVLKDETFSNFMTIIKTIINTLLKELDSKDNNEKLKYIAKLIKMSLYTKSEKNILLFDEIIKDNKDIKDITPLFKEFSFWKFWFEDGLNQADLETFKVLKKIKNPKDNDTISYRDYLQYKKHRSYIKSKIEEAMKYMKVSNPKLITELETEYFIDIKKLKFENLL